MSWDATWLLPDQPLDRANAKAALEKVLSKHRGVKLGPDVDPDLEAFADDFESDDEVEGWFEFQVGLYRRLLSEHGDQAESEPDDDGLFWAVIVVMAGDEDGPPMVTVHSNDGQNRSCWMTIGTLAGELSVALGGRDEPEAN